MAENDSGGTVHGSSEGGIAGKHPTTVTRPFLAGSATADQSNTFTFRLVPIACFRVDDIRFAFNSSFVISDPNDENNDIRKEMHLLVDLLEANPQSPLSVFGHADPVGNDDYNKQLSGRRATVIYALLISGSEPDDAVKLWQQVAKAESWDSSQRQQMQLVTGLPDGTPDTDLFKAYMQKLMPLALKLGKKDFLAQGKDPKGKGDYQGCSEFNPQLIFSEQRNKAFEKDADKTARNDANSINRRVIVLLFQKGSKVEPANWPCPRATEGAAVCRTRFFANGEGRRSKRLPDTDRRFDDKQDTFACRFYHKLLTDSACESAMTLVKIRLFDAQARPLPFAPCVITEAGQKPRAARATGARPTPAGTTAGSPPGDKSGGDKEEGLITLRVQNLPTTANVRWSRPKATEGASAPLPNPADLDDFEFGMDVTIDVPTDANQGTRIRLKNLGYDTNPPKPVPGQDDPIKAFQRDYQKQFPDLVVDGTLNQPTVDDSKASHDANDPVLRAGSDIAVKR